MSNDSNSRRAHMSTKREVREGVAAVARHLKLQPVTLPVFAVITWYMVTNRVADSDNLAPTLKHALDGLRAAGVLEDDSARHVVGTAQRIYQRRRNPFPQSPARVVLSLYAADDLGLPHIAPSPSATLASEVATT